MLQLQKLTFYSCYKFNDTTFNEHFNKRMEPNSKKFIEEYEKTK